MALASLFMLGSCTGDQAMPPFELPEELGDQKMGDGTWDNPMAAYMAALGRIPTDENGEKMRYCWVSGYIVGWIDTSISFSDIALSATFNGDATLNSNIMIASRPDETDPTKIATVQLWDAARTALNLQDNDNIGKLVSIYGLVGKAYCGQNGVREVSIFNWGDEGIEPDPLLITEFDLKRDTAGFTFEQISCSDPDFTIWTHSSSYGIVATGYTGSTRVASEAIAISPMINLENRVSAAVNIHQAANYFSGQSTFLSMCETLVRAEGETEWTTLTLPTAPSGNSFTYVDSGDIDLSEFVGKKIQLGFLYTSTTTLAGTWEIDKITVTGEKSE